MDDNSWMEVFTVVKGTGDKDDYWLKVGRMFPHRNGDGGFNIVLNALPLNGKLVIKPRRRRVEQSESWFDEDNTETVE